MLDPKYTGLVFGLSARIHVLVQDVKEELEKAEIEVESPQFQKALWLYGFESVGSGGGVKVVQLDG